MKSRHRHQLETNVLADRLGRLITKLRPYGSILRGALVLVVGWRIYTGMQARRSLRRQQAGWDSLLAAELSPRTGQSAQLGEVAHEFSEMLVRPVALLGAADVAYGSGLEECIRDYGSAQQKWERALKWYQEVLAAPGATRQQRARAQLGLGWCHESLVRFSLARRAYQTTVQDYPGTLQADEAKKRLKALADSSVIAKVFYGRLRAQKRLEPTALPATTQPGEASGPSKPTGDTPDN